VSIEASQTQPQITSLILNPAASMIGMTAADKKMHNHFFFYALPDSFYAKIHAQFLPLCRICAQRFSYYGARTGPDTPLNYQRSWNNFLIRVFMTVLKLFVSWNIIPHLSTNYGISIFQLFHSTSTRREYYSKVIPNIPARRCTLDTV
jgi:hypothetical protein